MQDTLIEKTLAWQTPLFFVKYPLHGSSRDSLLAYIQRLVDQQEQAIDSSVAINAKCRMKESGLDFFEQAQEDVDQLKSFITSSVEMVAGDVNVDAWPDDMQVEVKVVESWYHVTENGGYHDVHSHPNCSWCGIYYLDAGDCDEGSGVNRFYEPRVNADHYMDVGSLYLQQEGYWDVVPQSGQLVIFPSYLKHSALAYYGSRQRVVIAFNCTVKVA